MPVSRSLSAVAVAGALLTAGACGQARDGTEVTAAAPTAAFLAEAGEQTATVDSGRAVLEMSMSLGSMGELSLAVDGVWSGERSRAGLDFEGVGGLLEAEGDLDQLGGLGMPLSYEMITDGSTVYLPTTLLGGVAIPGVDADTEWVAIEVPMAAGETNVLAEDLGVTDGRALLDLLADAGAVEVVGEDEVDGVATTRHRVEVDPSALDPEALGGGLGGFTGSSELTAEPMPVEVWIDADGLVRRLRVEPVVEAEMLGALRMVFDLTLSDLGEPIEVGVPDPATVTVVDMGDLPGLFAD